jgi:electron transfer flavoprotein beta subunit
MAAKKKEIRKASPPSASVPRQKIVNLYVPEKTKKTQIIGGSPAEAAKELVRRLRDEARVIQ